MSTLRSIIVGMPDSAWGFIIALLAIGLVAGVRYILPLITLTLQLRRFERWVTGPTARIEGNPPGRGKLAEAWRSFSQAWKTTAIEISGHTRGMASPQSYFTSTILLRGLGRAIPIALPGVFAGIGILGTFVGIVLGLSNISIGNETELMDSVRTLLAGMSTAFTSSIVGIVLSILWLLGHRTLLGHLDQRLAQVCGRLEAKFPIWDGTSLLRWSLDGQRQQLRVSEEQKAILQTLGTDISEAMETALANTVTPALTGLAESFTSLSGDIRAQQSDGMGQLAEEFHKKLMESANEDFGRLGAALAATADVQERSSRELTAFLDQLERVSGRQTALLEATTAAADQFEASIGGLTRIHDAIRESVPAFIRVAESAATLVGSLNAETEAFSESNAALRTALAQQLDAVQTQVDRLTAFWQDFGQSLEQFRTELGESITEFRNVAAERIRDVFEQFDKEMAKVIEHLSGTLAELREVTEDLPSRVEQLGHNIETLREPVGDLVAAFQSDQAVLNRHAEHVAAMRALLEQAVPLEKRLSLLDQRGADLVAAMSGLQAIVMRAATDGDRRASPTAPLTHPDLTPRT